MLVHPISSYPSSLRIAYPKAQPMFQAATPAAEALPTDRNSYLLDAWQPGDEKLSLPQRLCLTMIWGYQKVTHYKDKNGQISHRLGTACPYYPHCSLYTAQAIRKYGVIKGILMGAYRILRCNPFTINQALKNTGNPNSYWRLAWKNRLDEIKQAIPDPLR